MCVAAAIVSVVGAVVGAAGTVIAGHEAASATRDSTNAAIAAQQKALTSQQQLAQPFINLATGGTGAGGGGPSPLQSLQSLVTPGSSAATLATLPGYQFTKEQGIQGTEAAANAMGLGLSGNTLEGLSKFTTGLADTTFQQEVGALTNVVGLGQAAAAGQAANIGNAAANVGNIAINQGNTLAGIDANVAAGLTKAVGSGVNNYILANTLAGLNQQPSPAVDTTGLNAGGGAGNYWDVGGPPVGG